MNYKKQYECKRSTRVSNRSFNKKYFPDSRRSQISIEYIIILSFVMFGVITVLGMALFYSGVVKDQIKLVQIGNFANKIVSTAASVYYYGEPSKATISVYLPEGVSNITIIENSLYIATQVSSGIDRRAYTSQVPINGTITTASGVKTITITAIGNLTQIISK